MKHFILSLSLLMVVSLAFSQSISRDVTASAGDYFVTETASLSWTLGETVIATFEAEEVVLTQGFQQYHYTILSDENLLPVDYSIDVYPNPAKDFLNIEITSDAPNTLYLLEMFDVRGMKLIDQKVSSSYFYNTIDLSSYSSELMLVRITDLINSKVSTYKIFKVRF